MRLGVIADVHGNLPALEAVLTRLAGLAIDRIVNLGDCASGPLWPAETVQLLRASAMSHVRGNHDRALGAASPDGLGASDAYAWRNLDAEARGWLAGLPFDIEIGRARCFHVCPKDDETYLLDEVEGGRLVAARPQAVAALARPCRLPPWSCAGTAINRACYGSMTAPSWSIPVASAILPIMPTIRASTSRKAAHRMPA
jgi:hypothetical protein